MTFQFASLTILAALTSAALGQPATQPTKRSATAAHHTASSRSVTPPNIPKVPGVPKTLYALKYIDIKVGVGPLAEPRKYYSVRYTGWLKDGTKFDSSYDHPGGEPLPFPYGAHRVIPGWDTGFDGMRIGGKRRLFIPYQLAYGEAGRPPIIPAKADLIFDIELVSQSDTPPAPKPPVAPPATAPQQPANPPATQNSQPRPTEAAPDATPKPAAQPSAEKPAQQPAPPAQSPPHPESR